MGSGYPESKWVGERILTLAAEQTNLAPVIVRIGQLSGGRNGGWNPNEWVPSVVRSGQLLGCLPRAPGVSIGPSLSVYKITDDLPALVYFLDPCSHCGVCYHGDES